MKLRLLVLCALALVFVPAASAMHWLDAGPLTITITLAQNPVEATGPGGGAVIYTVSMDDPADPSPVLDSCSPASGTTLTLGSHDITCFAHDSVGNIATATVTVTVQDTTPPTLGTMPTNISDTTEDPTGKVEIYGPVTATDSVDPSPSVSCSPSSGSKFPVGTTSVHCHASDASSNTSGDGTFTVTITLVDHTAPTLTVPASFSVDTENPSGTAVSYSATAIDNVDPHPTVDCTPGSGSSFPIGSTTVSCTAHDASSNTSQPKTFTITVNLVDHTPPVFSNVPASKAVEANGPSGSVVTYTTPTAADALDGPIASVSCAPASGSKFSITTTTVTCSASDSHGNTGQASFTITVHDTTPPTLYVPGPRSVYATTPAGIPSTAPGIPSFLGAASATDIVDPHPVVTNNAPPFIPVGTWTIKFGAHDASGNATFKDVALIILPQPPPGTPPLPIPPAPKPPAEVQKLKAVPGSGTVKLTWALVPGAKQYVVYRSESAARKTAGEGHGQIVYTGTKTTFTDRGLVNGTEYRYVVVAEDAAGNQSGGTVIVVAPQRDLLRSPKNGARLTKAPKLVWARDAEASYYNAQLIRNGMKILSVWPTGSTYKLTKSWTFDGHKYKLKAGVYKWFVWPGYGPRSQVAYGQMLGSRSFRIVG
jgi:HYR domain